MPIPTGERPFDQLAAELIAWQVADQPVLGTSLGLTDHDDRLPDMSADAIAARERAEDDWLDRFAAVPGESLTHDERIDRDLVVMALTGRRLMRDWYGWRRNPDGYAGAALNGLHLLLLHRPSPEPELAAAVAARLAGIPALLAHGEANLDADLASPDLVRRALGMARAGVAYARDVPSEFSETHRSRLAEVAEPAAVAFERFAAFLERFAERARGEWAIGEQRYDGLLRHAEGLPYGARELRDRGAAVHAELAANLRTRTRRLRGDDDWRALLEQLNADHPGAPEDMLEAYREATGTARRFCADHDLVTLPEGEQCDVRPAAPFTRPVIAVAHYIAPPPFADGRHAGTFFVPYPPEGATPDQVRQRLASNSFSSRWTTSVHEAYPGHHWHLSHIAATLRRPLRFVFGSSYFSEGWALYAEEMMREQGFFPDPRHELRQVHARAFRAARIVVDTSLHLGEMGVDEAVGQLSAGAALPLETARTEVLRYCAWPTQAASYLTGALEIQRLAQEWLHAARGSLKEFHDVIAGTGRLPISLAERCLTGTGLVSPS
jgi:uncharacterized protein (DUF885 family)